MQLNALATECNRIAEDHGFYCPDFIMGEIPLELIQRGEVSLTDLTLSKIDLIHSELSEMTEAARSGDFLLFAEEMADVFIRLLHMAGAMNIDIEQEISIKMKKNEARPFRHGKLA